MITLLIFYPISLFLLQLLLLYNSVCEVQGVVFDKIYSTPQNEHYLVSVDNRHAQRIADKTTLSILLLEEMLQQHKEKPIERNMTIRMPALTLSSNPRNTDEVTLFKIQHLISLQDSAVEEIFYLGPFVNPAIFWLNNSMYMTSSRYIGKNNPRRNITIYELTYPPKEAPCTFQLPVGAYKCIRTRKVNVSLPLGQDPRPTLLNGHIRLTFGNHFSYRLMQHMREAYVDLFLHPNHTWTYDNFTFGLHPPIDSEIDEKNWTPFVYQDEILYVQYLNPFTVVMPDMNNITVIENRTIIGTQFISEFQPVALPWRYGEIRGGTNAIFISNYHEEQVGVYLLFFHSSENIGNPYRTYFMGALIFSSKPPFHILAITRYPLVPFAELYEGRWLCSTAFCGIDYVVFPTGIVRDGDHILVSMGRQDQEGWLVKMSLSKLLDNMETVDTYKGNWKHYQQHHDHPAPHRNVHHHLRRMNHNLSKKHHLPQLN